MNKTQDSVHATLAQFFAQKKGDSVRSGGRGRPVTITLEKCANEYVRTLPLNARKEAEKAPFETIALLISLRRPLTKAEVKYLATTSDAKFQAIRDGEPAQNDVNIRFSVPLAEGDVVETLQNWMENIILPSVSAAAKHSGRFLYVNLERWAIERQQRGGRKEGTEAGKGLEGLTARYQYAIYATDSAEKKGFLSLATVEKDGTVSRNYDKTKKVTTPVVDADAAAAARSERARKAALAGAAKRKAAKALQGA